MEKADKLDRGRISFEMKSWSDAYTQFLEAHRETPLGPEDLEKLAITAYLIGKDTDSDDFLTRAHHDFLDRGEKEQAARCAFWLGFRLMIKGQRARGSGWISRAGTILNDGQIESAINGYIMLPAALRCMAERNYSKAYATFRQALNTGDRFDDQGLKTLGRLGCGQALIRLGDTGEGVRLLDEAMIAVEADEVSPVVAGIVYCAVIEACQEIFDLRRAKEWTSALSRWCESQPDLVPFRGQCMIRRAEIIQLQGTLERAMDEIQKACELLTRPPGEPAAGEAFYRKGELYRIQGEYAQAEDAYRNASKWGRRPQPGMALLKLARNQPETARKMILQVYKETEDWFKKPRILLAYTEIMLAAEETRLAREAAEELDEIAAKFNTPFLQAAATHAHGSVLVAEKEAREALNILKKAWAEWEKLEAPYESARVRVLIAQAYLQLDDSETAEMEFDAARWAFQQLGATPDIKRVDSLTSHDKPGKTHGLTPRQLEVLRLVATGKGNRDIAEKLFISERTVERHVSDIFNKLEVSSRSAATAYAYRYKLV